MEARDILLRPLVTERSTEMMEEGKYKNLRLFLTDSEHEVVEELLKFRSEKS